MLKLLFCLSLLPPCLLGIVIWRYAVNVPYWDQWELVPLFERFAQGTLTIGDLFQQQNEYRQFFPHLIFIGLAWLTGWDVRYEMATSFLLACLVAFNVHRLRAQTSSAGGPQKLALAFIANLLIFSLVQYPNWFMGVQIVYFMPIACITSGIVVAQAKLGGRTKSVICFALAVVSTFSAANGILAWVVLLPVLALAHPWPTAVSRNRLVLWWTVGLLSSAALYLYNLRAPAQHLSAAAALAHPAQALSYFLAFTGAPLAFERLALAVPLGAVLTLLFLLACSYLWRFSSDQRLTARLIGWLMLGAYSLLSAVLVTIGRVNLGVEQALSARYTTFSLYLIVALAHFIPIIFADCAARGLFIEWRALVTRAGFLLALLVTLGLLLTYVQMMRRTGYHHLKLQRAKASLLFMNFTDDRYLTEVLHPHRETLARRAKALDALGLLQPRLMSSNRVQDFAVAETAGNADYGSFERLVRTGDDQCLAYGWAARPQPRAAVDAVLLAYRNAHGNSIMFAIAEAARLLPPPAEVSQHSAHPATGWYKQFQLNALPADAVVIDAWTFDTTTGKARKLPGAHPVCRPE